MILLIYIVCTIIDAIDKSIHRDSGNTCELVTFRVRNGP